MLSHVLQVLEPEACSDRYSTCDRSRRDAWEAPAGSLRRSGRSTTRRKIRDAESCRSLKRISCDLLRFSRPCSTHTQAAVLTAALLLEFRRAAAAPPDRLRLATTRRVYPDLFA